MSRSCIFIFLLLGVGIVMWLAVFNPAQNTITLTENGFRPTEITIQIGDTITFVNKRDKYFWPASDFHPTHAVYSEFDSKEALAPGASWNFTFNQSGLFKYHDHLAPFFFGIVRVRDENGDLIDNCEDRGGSISCWQDQIFIALAEDGIGGAYDEVSKLYEREPAFARSCHFIAHNIGLASYGFYLENSESIMSPKASVCASGFYHGFMEAYLGATGDLNAARDTCDQIGTVLGDEAPDARFQCYHGIGHGAMEILVAGTGSFGNLDQMVDEALHQCELASDGKEERFRCASGIFNGIANFYINGEYGLDVSQGNLLRICAQENESYAEACYGNMNSVAFWLSDNRLPESVELALSDVDEKQSRTIVTYLAGLYAFDSLPEIDAQKVITDCRALGTHNLLCVEGFVHGLLEHGPPQKEYKLALNFCESELLTTEEQNVCYTETLSELDGWYSPSVVEQICSSLPTALRAYCKE